MDPKAKKTLEQIEFLLDKANKDEGIKYMLVACHEDNGAVFFHGTPKHIGAMLAEDAFSNKASAQTLRIAFELYIQKLEAEREEKKENGETTE
jgi:hypothetical protein